MLPNFYEVVPSSFYLRTQAEFDAVQKILTKFGLQLVETPSTPEASSSEEDSDSDGEEGASQSTGA